MSRQKTLLRKLLRAAPTMIQGGLSETTRRCGNPNCACHRDPDRRHGPHLYITWTEKGRSRSLYVPADRVQQARRAHAAWAEFWQAPSAWRLPTVRSFGSSAKKKNPAPGGPMVRLRHSQRNLGEVFFAREAESLMEAWMKEADEILEDEALLDLIYEQLGQRHPQSRKRGRNSTPSEVV